MAFALPARAAGPGAPPPPACTPGGTSSAGNCPSWGATVKLAPGTICTFNIGNATTGDYTYKVRNCSEVAERIGHIAGAGCDVINIIELNTSLQCECACNPANTCTVHTDPLSGASFCIDDPGRPSICKEDGFGYYDPERCKVCRGECFGQPPVAGSGSCETQAQLMCPPDQYHPPKCKQIAHKGCDCMCLKKSPCSLPPASCVSASFSGPLPNCDSGNYATCTKCDYDADGTFDFGTCTAHPPHCNSLAIWNRNECLRECSTPIMVNAADYIADATIQVISGDLNCDPNGYCEGFGACPWVSALAARGLENCGTVTGTTYLDHVCSVDQVFSNSCGCVPASVQDTAYGDHATIIYNPGAATWAGPFLEVYDAESATNCPNPDLYAPDALLGLPASDYLGAVASCPGLGANNQPISGCSAWGHTYDATMRFTTRVDECFVTSGRPLPKAMVCNRAVADAWAQCSQGASSKSSSFVYVGNASASQGAECVNGVPYNPAPKVVEKGELKPTTLVFKSGLPFLEVEVDVSRDRGAECSAPLGSGPCPTPVGGVEASTFGLTAEVCVAVPEPADEDP